MKRYLIQRICPRCKKEFDLVLKEGSFIAAGRHCGARWVLRLTQAEYKRITRK